MALAEIKLGKYATAPAAALADVGIHLRAQEYRRIASQTMVALDREEIPRRFPPGEYQVSKKVDGEFSLLAFDGARAPSALTVNPGGTVRVGLPALDEAAGLMKAAGLGTALFAAELYAGVPGRRPRVHDVLAVAARPESQADLDSLRLAVFDVVAVDGAPPPAKFAERWKLIQRVFGPGRLVRPMEAVAARTAQDIEGRFEEWVLKDGEEGIVVRSDSLGVFKVKPRYTIDAAVVGFTEGTSERTGKLHDMLVAVMRNDGTFHVLGRVGGGFTDEERRTFLSDLKDIAAASDYVEASLDHLAYQMARPAWVVEISVLDLISQSTRGAPIDRMVLAWHPAKAKWVPVRRLPLASPISPNFVRRREDKAARPQDVNIKQVADVVHVPMVDVDARLLELPKSTPLRREAYVKVMKGARLVRKLVLWKTNKEREPGWPAYVLHFTDFSPHRKTPLEREIRVSDSKEQIEALWDELAKEHIVRGWTAASGG